MIIKHTDDLAEIYDTIYQQFVNYDQEYLLYKGVLDKFNCKNTLEIGSGTGNLASRFQKEKYNYTGMDSSKSMIAIAKRKNKSSKFIHADMRDFVLDHEVDSVIISGRSTSYLLSNDDINEAFSCIAENLNENGILVFDFIDANRFIPSITENRNTIHYASVGSNTYSRQSTWELTAMDNFILEWHSKYYSHVEETETLLAANVSSVRVYTLHEMRLFLYLNNFEIIETIDRKSYAYDTFVIVARKKS